MALRPSSAIALLLPVLLLLACRLNLALAASGGAMGGDFFDSGSSFSDSFMSDPDPFIVSGKEVLSPKKELLSPRRELEFFILIGIVFGICILAYWIYIQENTNTLCKLQVAVFGGNTGSSIQSDLTRIAKAADTSSREGVSHLLIETIEALDRQPSSFIAGYSSVDLQKDRVDVKKCFDQLSNEERGKFDEVTLVNLNNVKRSSVNVFSNEDTLWNVKESINESQKLEEELLNGSGNEYIALDIKESADESQKFEEEELLKVFGNEYIVVTILVAAKGAHKLPNNNGAEDLKKALQKLRSILIPSKLLAGEVLWTPQKEDESLTGRKLLEDYPHLVESMKSFRVKKEE